MKRCPQGPHSIFKFIVFCRHFFHAYTVKTFGSGGRNEEKVKEGEEDSGSKSSSKLKIGRFYIGDGGE